ncbi:DUF4254 domain-containing protein [Nocardia sp. NBC_01329]|uniref:DUF4254 domain-containing protein n=1 Tax=Nocardia sp. NBC_01329 TaxID=2903594 RepID=UPI002E102243|nr:DUF4254 domain-containing protein [Nocardia sp. NBC_01329]
MRAIICSTLPTSSVDRAGCALPTGEALLSAIRGHHVGSHPLARVACELGQLHHPGIENSTRAKRHLRDVLARQADQWVAEHAPPPHPAATLHTESIGAVIDRIAGQQVRAYHLLMTTKPSDPIVHEEWYRLAQLIDDYTDLAAAVTHRARRLPSTPIS